MHVCTPMHIYVRVHFPMYICKRVCAHMHMYVRVYACRGLARLLQRVPVRLDT